MAAKREVTVIGVDLVPWLIEELKDFDDDHPTSGPAGASQARPADSQDECDEAALDMFEAWAREEGTQSMCLGFPLPWLEHIAPFPSCQTVARAETGTPFLLLAGV
jgi:hypothetical protein